MALPLDPKSYERRGEHFLVAEKVGSALALGFFAAGPNGALAYRSGNSGGWGSS